MKRVLITEAVVSQLRDIAAAAYPCETGGILVGVVARRVPWIVGAIELAEDRSPGHYIVPKGATQPAVRRARETIDPRVGYAGEWHSHTGDFGPSTTDRAAMRAVSWFVPRQPPGGPCFLLIRRTSQGWVVDGHRARFPQLLPVELIPTGPLPA
jgi:proteasome lid subunit RPN8/RPN11